MKKELFKFLLNRLFLIESILLIICLIKESYSIFFTLALIVLAIILFLYVMFNYYYKE